MFRPCIDIHLGKVKQIVGSTLSDNPNDLQTNFISDKTPAFFADMYKKDQLTGGHMIMLDSSEATKLSAIEALNTYTEGLQVGGGINSDNANQYLQEGASHIIVSSWIFDGTKLSKEKLTLLQKKVGKKRIVLDVSCRKKDQDFFCVINKWQTFTDLCITVENLKELSTYCDEFLIHGVDFEGKKQGIDEDLLQIISQFQEVSITYAGGVKSIKDIKTIESYNNGNLHFTVGSSLDIFGGDLRYEEVKKL